MPPRRRLETNASARVTPLAFLHARVGTNCVGVVVSTGRRARLVCPLERQISRGFSSASTPGPRFKKNRGLLARRLISVRRAPASAGQRGLRLKSAQLASRGLCIVRSGAYLRPLSVSTPIAILSTPLHPLPLRLHTPPPPPFPRSRHATPGIIAHRPRGYPGTFASYHSLCRLAANARLPNTAASIARFTRAPSIPATAHSPAYSKTSAA